MSSTDPCERGCLAPAATPSLALFSFAIVDSLTGLCSIKCSASVGMFVQCSRFVFSAELFALVSSIHLHCG